MKVARSTKERIADIKAAASAPIAAHYLLKNNRTRVYLCGPDNR